MKLNKICYLVVVEILYLDFYFKNKILGSGNSKKSSKLAKGVIKSKQDRQYNCQKKKTEGQAMIYKTLHIKKFEQCEPIKKRGEFRCPGTVNSSCSTKDALKGNSL